MTMLARLTQALARALLLAALALSRELLNLECDFPHRILERLDLRSEKGTRAEVIFPA